MVFTGVIAFVHYKNYRAAERDRRIPVAIDAMIVREVDGHLKEVAVRVDNIGDRPVNAKAIGLLWRATAQGGRTDRTYFGFRGKMLLPGDGKTWELRTFDLVGGLSETCWVVGAVVLVDRDDEVTDLWDWKPVPWDRDAASTFKLPSLFDDASPESSSNADSADATRPRQD